MALYSIAIKNNTTVQELKKLNDLTIDILQIGQIIKIKNIDKIKHIVQKGESLYSIAKKYNILVSELKNANNLISDILQIGQELIIP